MIVLPESMVDVFIDFENVGMARSVKLSLIQKNIRWLGDNLSGALQKEGYTLREVKVFARIQDQIPVEIQEAVYNSFENTYGWHMVWSNAKADTAFKGWVRELLENGELASTVLFITSDSDFARLAREVKASGRTVFVAGKRTSIHLRKAADRAFYI